MLMFAVCSSNLKYLADCCKMKGDDDDDDDDDDAMLSGYNDTCLVRTGEVLYQWVTDNRPV